MDDKELSKRLADKAYACFLQEDYIKADKLYRRAIDYSPGDPALWNDFGRLNYLAGDIDVADSAFTKAIELDPGYAPAWRGLCIMSLDNENYSVAFKRAQKALSIDDSDVNLNCAVKAGVLYAMNGNKPDKYDIFDKAISYYKRMRSHKASLADMVDSAKEKLGMVTELDP